MPSDWHSESFTHLGHCLYINLQFITGLLSFGILSSLSTLAVSIIIPQTSLMHWLFHFCLLSVPFTTAHGYGLSLKATLPLVTWVQVRWLKSWPLAKSNYFFLTHHCPVPDSRTHGCPDWWMFTVLLFAGHMVVPTGGSLDLAMRWYICQAVFCEWSMVLVWFWRWWICQAVFCDWSLEIGQVGISRWRSTDTCGPGSLLSLGVASSLDLDIFTSGCWSRCLPSDADVPSSDCDIFPFFYCAVQCLIRWSLCLVVFDIW